MDAVDRDHRPITVIEWILEGKLEVVSRPGCYPVCTLGCGVRLSYLPPTRIRLVRYLARWHEISSGNR